MDDGKLAALAAALAKSNPSTREGVDALFALEKHLSGEPEFAKPRAIVNGAGTHGWLPQFAAECILAMIRQGRSAADAVSWFRKAPSITSGRGGALKLLYGVTCKQPIKINAEIVLLPYAEIPRDSILEWIEEEHARANESTLVHGFKKGPAAALFRAGEVAQIFVNDPTDDWSKRPPTSWFEDLHTAARLLGLVPKAIPLEAAHWFHYDDPDIARLAQFGIRRNGSEIVPMMFTGEAEVLPEQVGGIFAAYQGLRKRDKDRVHLALNRIIRARSQLSPGNRAIDLSIAFEILFMNQDGGEHSYKICLRASRLVYKEPKARHHAFMTIRRLYELRSSMVHTGQAENEYNIDGVKISSHSLVESADELCVVAIREFLNWGGIPDDWKPIDLA